MKLIAVKLWRSYNFFLTKSSQQYTLMKPYKSLCNSLLTSIEGWFVDNSVRKPPQEAAKKDDRQKKLV